MFADAYDLHGVGAAGAAQRFAYGEHDQVAVLDRAGASEEKLLKLALPLETALAS